MNLHLTAIAAAAILGLSGAPAGAQPDGWRGDIVPDAELDELRGGYLVAADLAFQFGAVMRTYENGALSLQTQFVWAPDGQQVTRLFGDGVTELSDADLGGIAGGVFVTPGGALMTHDHSAGQFMNLLINTENNRDFRQDLAITLVLPGFEATQSDLGRQLMGLRLADEISLGSVFALGG